MHGTMLMMLGELEFTRQEYQKAYQYHLRAMQANSLSAQNQTVFVYRALRYGLHCVAKRNPDAALVLEQPQVRVSSELLFLKACYEAFLADVAAGKLNAAAEEHWQPLLAVERQGLAVLLLRYVMMLFYPKGAELLLQMKKDIVHAIDDETNYDRIAALCEAMKQAAELCDEYRNRTSFNTKVKARIRKLISSAKDDLPLENLSRSLERCDSEFKHEFLHAFLKRFPKNPYFIVLQMEHRLNMELFSAAALRSNTRKMEALAAQLQHSCLPRYQDLPQRIEAILNQLAANRPNRRGI
jgi:hypothetical protein